MAEEETFLNDRWKEKQATKTSCSTEKHSKYENSIGEGIGKGAAEKLQNTLRTKLQKNAVKMAKKEAKQIRSQARRNSLENMEEQEEIAALDTFGVHMPFLKQFSTPVTDSRKLSSDTSRRRSSLDDVQRLTKKHVIIRDRRRSLVDLRPSSVTSTITDASDIEDPAAIVKQITSNKLQAIDSGPVPMAGKSTLQTSDTSLPVPAPGINDDQTMAAYIFMDGFAEALYPPVGRAMFDHQKYV